MIIPLLITAGILGTLYVTRETTPSKSELDADLARYNQIISAGRGAEIDPARLDTFAANLRRAGRPTDATVAEGWAIYVRNMRAAGPMQDAPPPALPPALPPASPAAPLGPAPLSPELQAQLSMLMQQGQAASPADLESLAEEISTASPGYDVSPLMRLALDNYRLVVANQQVSRQPAVGAYGAYSWQPAVGAGSWQPTVGSQYAAYSRQPTVGAGSWQPAASSQYAAYSRQPAAGSQQPGPMRCAVREGCVLYRTPASLYPTNVTVPFGSAVAVLGQEGDWLQVLHGTQRGWVQRAQFSTDFLPGAPARVPMQR